MATTKKLKVLRMLFCDFCGQSQENVAMMIRGRDEVHICDTCVHVCLGMLAAHEKQQQPSLLESPPADAAVARIADAPAAQADHARERHDSPQAQARCNPLNCAECRRISQRADDNWHRAAAARARAEALEARVQEAEQRVKDMQAAVTQSAREARSADKRTVEAQGKLAVAEQVAASLRAQLSARDAASSGVD